MVPQQTVDHYFLQIHPYKSLIMRVFHAFIQRFICLIYYWLQTMLGVEERYMNTVLSLVEEKHANRQIKEKPSFYKPDV
jgi:hypothetical protein